MIEMRMYTLPWEREGKTPIFGVRVGFTQEMMSKMTLEGQERIIQAPSESL